MSHYTLYVMMTAEEYKEGGEGAVDARLAPFSEELEVYPYDRPCYCVGLQAHREAQRKTEEVYDIKVIRAGYWERVKSGETVESDESWKATIRSLQDYRDSLLEAHPLKDSPNPDCTDCDGSGVFITTNNPNGFWDWYKIGGRWNGDIPNNAAPANQAVDLLTPFAILDPDGNWHSKGKMGWFGISYDTIDNWPQVAREVLERYPDHVCVLVDCHT